MDFFMHSLMGIHSRSGLDIPGTLSQEHWMQGGGVGTTVRGKARNLKLTCLGVQNKNK